MILKIMSLTDVLAAITLILIPFDLVNWKIVILLTIYLLAKAYHFRGDFASMMDGITGIYMLITFLGVSSVLSPIFCIYLLQKSVYSLL